MNENRTTLTLKNNYGEYSVTVNKVDFGIQTMFDELVLPVLLASGYNREGITDVFGC